MKVLLICPSERAAVGLLAERVPLCVVPLLGQSLLEYWLTHLAGSGVKQVMILASDRPEQVVAMTGHGERWGLTVTVVEESRELTPAQALLKYEKELDPATAQRCIAVLDYFPGLPEFPLFTSYQALFSALQAWMPKARTPDRVGVREVQPGVWVGLHSHLSPQAKLAAPCWIGRNVFVGAHALLGPATIVEDGAFIEPAATIAHSVVGPDTFVGRLAELANSVAWGSTLINWQTGSLTKVPDPFLLCALRQPRPPHSPGWFARLSELYSRNKADVHLLWKHFLMNKEG
jgi:NDP-sugar pyrophosphorylase family protein